MGKTKILIIEDEKKIAEIVKTYLNSAGYQVSIASDGTSGLAQAETFSPDLIILDLMLPDKEGEEVCEILRAKSSVPILMVTAKSQEEERIKGFSLGADDYLAKPFSPRELVARVRAILRRTKDKKRPFGDMVRIGKLSIEVDRHIVKRDGHQIDLTPSEFNLLLSMAKYPRQVFTREELIEAIRDSSFEVYDRTIDAHIKNLRRKIEPDPDNPVYVKTVRGFGYKLGEENEA